jgi:hypothetical protein
MCIPGDLLSITTPSHSTERDGSTAVDSPRRPFELRAAETKAAFKTSEFAAYLAAVVGVLIASYLVGEADGRGDVFLADQAWFYVTLLTIGYMISRGLAKAGSRHHDA